MGGREDDGDNQEPGERGEEVVARTEDENAKVQRKSVLEAKQHLTGKVSELCRYIGFGLLALVYGLFTTSAPEVAALVSANRIVLYVIGACAGAVILFDYLQYLFAIRAVDVALANEEGRYLYKRKQASYVLRGAFFSLKQIATLAASGALVVLALEMPRQISQEVKRRDDAVAGLKAELTALEARQGAFERANAARLATLEAHATAMRDTTPANTQTPPAH